MQSGFSKSLIGPAAEWLERNGANPSQLVADAERRLRERGRSLPREHLERYNERVLIGEFLHRWSKKHRGRCPRDLMSDPATQVSEMRPFELALISAGDERAFARLTRHFTRKRMAERVGIVLGTAEDFTACIAINTLHLADKFMRNFDPSRGETWAAVRYLQLTAMSFYLSHGTSTLRAGVPNLGAYLAQSKRIHPRTALAIKLAYSPALLTSNERTALRDNYSFLGNSGRRMPIKDIALLLGYKNAAALSRKLYRVRQWYQLWSAATVEVAQ